MILWRSHNIDFATFGAKYEGRIEGYQASGSSTMNVGTFSLAANRLYIFVFGGGAYAGKISGMWRVYTGSYGGTQIGAAAAVGPNSNGMYSSASSPVFYIPTQATTAYVSFIPDGTAEWTINCNLYSIEAMTQSN